MDPFGQGGFIGPDRCGFVGERFGGLLESGVAALLQPVEQAIFRPCMSKRRSQRICSPLANRASHGSG